MSDMKLTPPTSKTKTSELLLRFPPQKENLLNILHAMQDSNSHNYLSEEDLAAVAAYLNLPKSSVMGVATYYSMYSVVPRGKHILRVCVSPVCQLMKGEEALQTLQSLLGIKAGETSPCGNFTLEKSECLGHCEASPCMMVNSDLHDSLTHEKIAKIIDNILHPGSSKQST